MSALKIILHVKKTLKTIIQKNLSKCQELARKKSAAEFHYSQTIFVVHSNFTYASEANDLMKFYFGSLLEMLVSSI